MPPPPVPALSSRIKREGKEEAKLGISEASLSGASQVLEVKVETGGQQW